MKKITLLFIAFLIVQVMQSQTVLSQSTSQIVANGAVACANSGSGFTLGNTYYRSYVPSTFGQTGTISIKGGEFGYTFTDTGATNPTIPVLVQAYSTTAAFPGGTLTEIAQATVDIDVAGTSTVVSFDFDTPVNIDATDEIVVGVTFPDGDVLVVDTRIGQNTDGETAPSYISTPNCGGIDPITFSGIGFSGNAIINLTVDTALAVNELEAFNFTFGPNPVNNVLTLKAQENITNVSIVNLLGQEVIKAKPNALNATIDLSNIDNGAYFIKAQINDKKGTFKIIKN